MIALGYLMGPWFGREHAPEQRQRWLLWAGVGALALFVLLRFANDYGDAPWQYQATTLRTWLSIFNVTKYPPSLQFLLLTLGWDCCCCGCTNGRRWRWHCSRWPISAPRRCSSTCCTCTC